MRIRSLCRRSSVGRRAAILGLASGLVLTTIGCRQDMHDQPRYEALEASAFFDDGMASRPFVEGTVARGRLRTDDVFFTGKDSSGELTGEIPIEMSRETLESGREGFDVFCSPCHGRLGDGQGMVVRRGFKEPPSFHTDRLLAQPPGYYYDVITNGFGVMSSYATMVTPRERWEIVAYLRVLQESQRARLAALPEEDREAVAALDAPAEAPTTAAKDDDGGGH